MLGGSVVPGGAIVGESAEESSCQGEPHVPTTRPCEGTGRKLVGMARICEDTNTGDGNLGF